MKRFCATACLVLFAATALAADDPWAGWAYRLKLRVTQPELADFTGLARVRVNLPDGIGTAKDLADVRVLDDKLREQPWRLLSASSAGDVELVFYAVKGCRDYALIYGNASKSKPNYDVPWPLGKALIDDALPKKAYIHGLWSWVTTRALSGEYSHTSPVTDRFNYHGSSEFPGVTLYEETAINQYVFLDPDNPPGQIVLRLVFESEKGTGSWKERNHVNLYWGARNIKDLPGRSLKMGDLPPTGRWQKLSANIGDLLGRTNFRWAGGGIPDLYGIEFCTDRGRAYWDLTTIGEVPADTEIVALERAAGAKPAFVWQKRSAFKLGRPDGARGAGEAGTATVLTELRFVPSDKRVAWDFGDGATSEETAPLHVFDGTEARKVTMTPAEGEPCVREVASLRGSAPAQSFAVELVSCPFVVRADDKALFNLRLEGGPPSALAVETRAVLLDAKGSEIRRERTAMKLLPGDKHPAFKAFSLDVSSPSLARVRFELLYGGRLLASRAVEVRSSCEALDGLRIEGDRFVDAAGSPVVVLVPSPSEGGAEVAPAAESEKTPARKGAPAQTLVVGRPPIGSPAFADRLRTALATDATLRSSEDASSLRSTSVRSTGSDSRPAWSMPARQLLALATEPMTPQPDVVLVTSAWEMMLAGVPARAAADALGACVDQIRRRTKAEVLLVAPVVYAGLEDLSRQYVVALRLLGIEKNVTVIDLYSRSIRLGDEFPEILKTSRVESGVLVRGLHPRVAEMTLNAIVSELRNPAPAVRTSD